MDLQLTGKRAVVTGGSRGIGYAIAGALAAEAEAEASLAAGNSIRRIITAAEVADVVAFLASPRSVAINGDAVVAGGRGTGRHPLLSRGWHAGRHLLLSPGSTSVRHCHTPMAGI